MLAHVWTAAISHLLQVFKLFQRGCLGIQPTCGVCLKGWETFIGNPMVFRYHHFPHAKCIKNASDWPDWDKLGYAPGIIFDEHDRTKIPGNHLGYPLDAASPI